MNRVPGPETWQQHNRKISAIQGVLLSRRFHFWNAECEPDRLLSGLSGSLRFGRSTT